MLVGQLPIRSTGCRQKQGNAKTPIRTKIVGKNDAMFVPLLKLALKASVSLSYTQAMRTEHASNLKFAGSLPLQSRDADMNLGSSGGPMVLFKARAEEMRSERVETRRT